MQYPYGMWENRAGDFLVKNNLYFIAAKLQHMREKIYILY